MNAERWKQVERIFGLALDAAPDEREAIVDRECGDDDELRRDVSELLDADARSSDPLAVVSVAVKELAAADTEVALPQRAQEAMGDLGIEVGGMVENRYRVDGVLGAGGMGVVVEATHVALDERVAMKLLRPRAMGSERARQRFLREARAAAKLRSEHIAKVRDVGVTDTGAPFMVMDLLSGCDVQQLIKARGALPIAEAVAIVLQACEALAVAHATDIVHRDIKPANLFLESGQGVVTVKLLDFGISKLRSGEDEELTGSSDMIGSPAYMSPEQLRVARDVDERADIWSLGVVLFEALTGQRPFRGESLADLSMAILAEPRMPVAEDIDAPEALIAIVDRCVQKDRDDRFRRRRRARARAGAVLSRRCEPRPACVAGARQESRARESGAFQASHAVRQSPGDTGPGDSGPGDGTGGASKPNAADVHGARRRRGRDRRGVAARFRNGQRACHHRDRAACGEHDSRRLADGERDRGGDSHSDSQRRCHRHAGRAAATTRRPTGEAATGPLRRSALILAAAISR